MRTACAYIRVSTDSQDEYSPDAQIRLLKEYAAANDILISDFYKDIGISGRKADKRPEFQNMIAEAKSKEHPYDVILVWKFSRFARNQEESIVYKSLLKKNNVEVVSVSEPLPEGFIGELVERIFEWMDEYYSIRLSGEVKRGMTQKALSGGYNGQPPIGYIKEKGPDTVPYPDSYYAEMVKMCFHMWTIEEKSLTYIASTLNKLGYRTRKGNKWETRNIVDMIQNPFYTGQIRWNYVGNRARQLTGETIIVDGKHEPIIDKELWNNANTRYQRITAANNHSKRETIHKHWLSGMLKCSCCGSSLAYQKNYNKKKDKSFPAFVCHRAVKGMCETRNSINQGNAEEAVIRGLKELANDSNIIHIEPITKFKNDTNANKQAIINLENKLKRAKEAYLSGIDTITEYKDNKSRIEAEINKLKEFDIDVPVPEPITHEKIKSVYEFLETCDIITEKANAIQSIIDYIVYDKSTDSMQFYLKNQ